MQHNIFILNEPTIQNDLKIYFRFYIKLNYKNNINIYFFNFYIFSN